MRRKKEELKKKKQEEEERKKKEEEEKKKMEKLEKIKKIQLKKDEERKKRQEEEEKKKKEEIERKKLEEEQKKKKSEEIRQKKEEEQKIKKEEEEKKNREEKEKAKKEEEEKKRKLEEERKNKEKEDKKKREEIERIKKEEEEKKKKEEDDRIRKLDEQRKKKEEEQRQKKEDDERIKKEEEQIKFLENKKRIEEDRKRKSLILKLKKEEEERLKKIEDEQKEKEFIERRKTIDFQRKRKYEEMLKKKEEEERRKKEEEEAKRKEYEEKVKRIDAQRKKKMLENQMRLRKTQLQENMIQKTNEEKEKEKNNQINEVLEDMCTYGNVMKSEIKEEKEKNPDKFVETKTALQLETSDQGLFALGLISQNLESIGVETVIEKEDKEDEQDSGATCMQFIANGMMEKKKYDLHFEFGEKRNEELLNNEDEYNKFKEKLKLKLSKDFNIPPEKIIVTFPQKGSFHVQVIFQSDEFNSMEINDFKEKFKNDNEFKELSNLKEIHEDVIVSHVKLSKSQLDSRGNRTDGWGVNECRGGKPYDPPIGWIGIGLKVLDKYENNKWIGMSNVEGEWCVAYHGVCSGQISDNVKHVTGLIYKGNAFRPGGGQAHAGCPDAFHPGKTVGNGVYCTPTIKTAEGYAGKSTINGQNYKTVLMVRVNPSAIRHCDNCPDSKAPNNYWVVNGTTDEIRPYRILYKKC